MKSVLLSLFATIFVAFIFAQLFSKWRASTLPKSIEAVNLIEQMEVLGIPEFQAKSLDGVEVSSKSFSNKIVVLNFWASWCAPCLEEFPSLIKAINRLNGEAILLALSQDSEIEDIQSFIKAYPGLQNSPNIIVLTDFDHSIAQKFKADRLPESYIFGKDGKLKKKIVGTIDWSTEDAEKYLDNLIKN